MISLTIYEAGVRVTALRGTDVAVTVIPEVIWSTIESISS